MNSADSSNIAVIDKLEENKFKVFTNSVLKDLKD